MLKKRDLKPWLDGFLKDYSKVHRDKPVVRVLVLCPKGTKRSVACAEILKYIVEAKGMVCDTDIEHISKKNWQGHCRICNDCRHPMCQPRRKEVLEKALQLLK